MPREQPAIERQRQALGTRIRDLRDHALLTQEDFAEMTGINRRTLQRIERGGDPRYSQLVRIAEALGVPLANLVEG
ncbi:helix-turn-helix domain-containing protein [Streptomyces sp. NBC_00441]|uniref:helix-turn-helix domain-containing protein n=1 Tax=Streptomyces sp. NBC_00441 TaxID=2975742 RepID=UPI002E2B6AEB|nr:helix-turn-helix transcriptional regulator [Streptomyces sp. NBC_00441]